jgi:TPR repeat protein
MENPVWVKARFGGRLGLLMGWLAAMMLAAVEGAEAGKSVADQNQPAALAAELVASAESGDANAQFELGHKYLAGEGVAQNEIEGAAWILKSAAAGLIAAQIQASFIYRDGVGVVSNATNAFYWMHKAADQGNSTAQYELGLWYRVGLGVARDFQAASQWARKAADQGHTQAQYYLGMLYANGQGVAQNDKEAAYWFRLAALQGDANAQFSLGVKYDTGKGVRSDYVEAYKWLNLAAAQGNTAAMSARDKIVRKMAREQIEEAQRRSAAFKAQPGLMPLMDKSSQIDPDAPIEANGTGFFVSDDGYLLTAYHLVVDARKLAIKRDKELLPATLIKSDPANDLALLKVTGQFKGLPLGPSRTVKIGDAVFTLGFPFLRTPATDPVLSEGNIKNLSGPQDDPRLFQVSLGMQMGNSGGPLIDSLGNAVAMVHMPPGTTIPRATEAPVFIKALKGSYASVFLESVPDLVGRLKPAATTAGRKFDELVKESRESVALVLAF